MPNNPEVWFGRGIAALQRGDYAGAENCFRRTLELAPDSREPLLNLGYALDNQDRPDEALRCYESVLEIDPGNAKAHYNRSAHQLRSGDLRNGFADYEFRFAAIPGADNRAYIQPRWDGSPLSGRSILVYCEQGLGDALMFARYILFLVKMGARVILEVQPQLVSLMSGIEGVNQVVVKSGTPPLTDVHIPLLSLPHVFQTTLDSVPNHVPYLLPSDVLVSTWKSRVQVDSGIRRIGLVWAGKLHPYPNRSCPPEYLEPLLNVPRLRFYSLQIGDQGRYPLPKAFSEKMVDLTGMIRDFSDTAALIQNLDLVITIDTATAHLAGALGKPVWVMLPHNADWRWLSDRDDSPWYPSMRLFRQTEAGNWATVSKRIVVALQDDLSPCSMESSDSDDMQDSLFNSALDNIESGNPGHAVEQLSRLGVLQPDNPAVWFNLGRAYYENRQFREAEQFYRQALRLRPESPAIWFCLGQALLKRKAYGEAEPYLRRAHGRMPESVDILLALGSALVALDNVPEAFICCRKMLALEPENAVATYNMAYLQLRSGDFAAGFSNFEARLAVEKFRIDTRRYSQPRWDGSALDGKSILVFGEQGMGDVLQFCRYIPLLAERGAHVVLEVDPPLVQLLTRLPGVAHVVAKSKTPPLTDCYVQLLSLPHLCGTTRETVPKQIPYIGTDNEKCAYWQQLVADETKLRVGIVWRGNPDNPVDQERSCSLAAFLPLANVSGVRFYSLQVGAGRDEISASAFGRQLVDYCDQLKSFDDTAALIANLDLIIGVDTATIHLAGALGKPTWVVLPHIYDWRWLAGESSSPWYPSVMVFWQKQAGDWDEVMGRVALALEKLLDGKESNPEEMTDIAACYNLGAQFKEQGNLAEAERCFRRIVEQEPELPDPQHSLGVVLQLQGRFVEAIDHYRAAISSDPAFVKAYFNLATSLWRSGVYAEAMEALRTTLSLDPTHREAHWLYGMLLLLSGEYGRGWQEYEWRWGANAGPVSQLRTDRPEWDGSPLSGRTLLIHMEQGRGDMLQFIRYAPLAAARGGRIIVAALGELTSLLASVEGVAQVVDSTAPLPEFDLHIPVLSLPRVMGTTIETIPASIPYLKPDKDLVATWSRKLSDESYALRIGIVWSGNEQPDSSRSCPFELFAGLFSVPHARFYSLQVGAASPRPCDGLVDYTGGIRTFSDSAALISTLDLVISIDTAVAHLAGALGMPVWTLLPFVPDWRWLLQRPDSPWYPGMVLFRQPAPGDWTSVFEQVRLKLTELCTGSSRHNQIGIALVRQGQLCRAAEAFSLAAELEPGNAEFRANLGAALDGLGRFEDALVCYQAAIELKPDFTQAHFNKGNTCRSLGRLRDASDSYEKVITLAPAYVPAFLCLGETLKEEGRFESARTIFERVLAINPSCSDAWQGIAEICQSLDEFDRALEAYGRALELEPGRVAAINMLGTVHQALGRLDEAESCYRRALEIDPDRRSVWNNLGTVLQAQERTEEAMEVLRHLVSQDPNNAEAHWNLSLALLSMGRYPEGWREYEWRFQKVNPVPRRDYPQPLWDGSPLNGRTVLLHSEQGFGDTLQFSRYAPLVAQTGGRVILECQVPSLKRLLHSLGEGVEVVVAGTPLPYFDCHLPLLSLPGIFSTVLETVPAHIPYLAAPPAAVEEWKVRLGTSHAFRVGLIWFGRQSQVLNRKRSCPLAFFAPLAAIPNVELFSLQVGEGSEQLHDLSFPVVDVSEYIEDFADTAACMANLDLVITIDSAGAHLAGAIGVRTWTLLPYGADWRWLQNRTDSPWYPTMRLFRQESRGDWPAVIDSVAEALQACVKSAGLSAASVQNAADCHAPERAHRLRVGLAWSGRQDNPLNRKRSCPFTALAPLFEIPGVSFFNLQLEGQDAADDRLVDLTSHIHNFEDTAALMANLDLVISIDTSVAHLAGATGRPMWVLLSHVADWRWLTYRGDSPWYPGVRLFHQPHHGDWAGVVREVAGQLAQLAGSTLDLDSRNLVADAECGRTTEREMLEQQLGSHREIARLHDLLPDAHLDVGASLALLGRHDEAVESFRRVLELDGDHMAGHLNLAYSLLALGNYSEGWHHFEWRLLKLDSSQLPPWPMLRQEEITTHQNGTSLLVHCEQGYGDTIQFSRFLPLLSAAGYRITVSCQPPLASLMASVDGVNEIVPHGEILPACDRQVLLLSLPHLFSTTLETVPGHVPYLNAREQLKKAWKTALERKYQKV